MKSPLNQLILLGFLCQALSWDDWLAPLLYTLLWLGCLTWGRNRLRARPAWEGAALVLGCAGALGLGEAFGRNTHFFIGHGLVLVQAVRLMRETTRSERTVAFFIALFHLGVACTFLFDLRFLLVLGAAVVLLPKALAELHLMNLPTQARHPGLRQTPLWSTLLIVLVTVTVFVVFPRGTLRAPLMPSRGGSAETSGVLDDILDPIRGVSSLDGRVVFHIQGDQLRYLRCLTLTDCDGIGWSAPARPQLRSFRYVPADTLGRYSLRRVRVRTAALLRNVLPTDGQVVFLTGSFFSRPRLNVHGGIFTDAMWNTANNAYSYWIDPNPPPEPLPELLRQRYLASPPITARVRRWLDERLTGVADPYEQAKTLEKHFETEFTYQLGAPALSRLAPLEDFLFEQRAGHCERFASALAILLRAQRIPSRVVIGYAATTPTLLSPGYTVRVRDAHSWVEAWFEDRGWVTLDGTPRATTGGTPAAWTDLLTDLDFAWSTYVVNLDAPGQSQLFGTVTAGVALAGRWLERRVAFIASVLVVVAVVVLIRKRGAAWARRWLHRRPLPGEPDPIRATHDLYDRMLNALAVLGCVRPVAATPLEFLATIESDARDAASASRLVTLQFCATQYGRRTLTPPERQGMEAAVIELEQLAHTHRRSRSPQS